MIDSAYTPQKIYIEKNSLDFPLTKRILKNASQVPREIIEDSRLLIEDMKISRNAIQEGKKYLLLTQQRGEFVKPCPCTPHYIGCNYFIINLELNCPLDCSYCILQHYLTNPLITIYVNLDDLWRELDGFYRKNRNRAFRIGTGELGDSLALDHITENSKDLIAHFKGKKSALFELKTKTTNIKNVLKQEPAENIIISWSLNTSKIAKKLERDAPALEKRIDAARQVMKKGFRVGFHFDPLVRYPGWEEDYNELIKILLKSIEPSGIVWISLGSLRFPPNLKYIIKKRFPKTTIYYDEFIMGKDGKFRYFKPLRVELYKKVVAFIKDSGGSDIPLYFCMESGEIWREVMRWVPRGKKEVERFLSPWSPLKKEKFYEARDIEVSR